MRSEKERRDSNVFYEAYEISRKSKRPEWPGRREEVNVQRVLVRDSNKKLQIERPRQRRRVDWETNDSKQRRRLRKVEDVVTSREITPEWCVKQKKKIILFINCIRISS